MNVMKQDARDDKIIERCKTWEKQCMQEGLDRSRSYWVAIELQRAHKITSIDWDMCRESIEKLPRDLDGSRICLECIEQTEST